MFNWRWAFVAVEACRGCCWARYLFFTVREPVRGRYAPRAPDMAQLPLGRTIMSLLTNRVFMGLALGWVVQS